MSQNILADINSHDEAAAADQTSAAEADRADQIDTFTSFDRWVEDYVAASGNDAAALEPEGRSLALKRRSRLAQLIKTDPERAITLAIPFGIRRKLPESVAQYLEERVSGLARFDVIASLPEPEAPQPGSTIHRFVSMNNRTFRAFVYGRRMNQASRESIPLHGIAIGNSMAVDENAVRRLEVGEAAYSSLPPASIGGRCPVSSLDGTPAIAVQAGSDIFYLCHEGHIAAFNEARESEETGIGPLSHQSTATASASTWTTAPKKILFMRVNFLDDPRESISEAEAHNLMRQVGDFFFENSYGALTITATVTPLLTLPSKKSSYLADVNYWALLDAARTAAEAAGFPRSSFELDCVHAVPEVISSPRGYVGGKGVWLRDSNAVIACHEFGHNLGLWHANGWMATDGSSAGPGYNIEYGNPFDTMGSDRTERHHFNVCHKQLLNWLPESGIQTITSNGVYRLYPFDVPTLAAGLTYALRIRKDEQRDYWIETRQSLNSAGLLINWSPWSASGGGSQLLDMTPGSQGGRFDAALTAGYSFYDPALGLKIIPSARTTPEFLDVSIKRVHYLTIEAESGELTQPMSLLGDPLASQGECIAFATEGGAGFTVQIPADGEYFIWGRTRCAEPGAIPLSISVDNKAHDPNCLLEGARTSDWNWSRITKVSNALPKSIAFTAVNVIEAVPN